MTIEEIIEEILDPKSSLFVFDEYPAVEEDYKKIEHVARFALACSVALGRISTITTDHIFDARGIARAQLKKYKEDIEGTSVRER